MHTINNLEDLEKAIKQLEAQREHEWTAVKNQLGETLEDLRPTNLLTNAIQDVIHSPELQKNLLDSAIGMSTGFLAKKLVFGQTRNPVSLLLGAILETAVSNNVSKHPEGIKSVGKFLLNKFFGQGKTTQNGHAKHLDEEAQNERQD